MGHKSCLGFVHDSRIRLGSSHPIDPLGKFLHIGHLLFPEDSDIFRSRGDTVDWMDRHTCFHEIQRKLRWEHVNYFGHFHCNSFSDENEQKEAWIVFDCTITPPGWLVTDSLSRGVNQTLIPSQPQAAYKAHGCVLTGIPGEGTYWAPRRSSDIRNAHELESQSPAPIELRDPQVVLPPCRLDNSIRDFGWDPLNQRSATSGQPRFR